MEYSDYFHVFTKEFPDLSVELAPARSLQGVLSWMTRRGLELNSVEIITQDEFSLDFIIPLVPGERHLVFGIT